MTALSTQLAIRAHELLNDGEWHSYEDVMITLGKLVPPGMALRRAERDRRLIKHKHPSGIKMHAPEQRVVPRSDDELIASGRRAIVREHLGNTAVYQTDRKGSAANPHDPKRRIRMIGTHRSISGDPRRLHRDRLQHENEQLRDQLALAHEAILDLATAANPEHIEPQTAALVRKLMEGIEQ